ncbi:MAG: TspO/MBR family protein [Patescibacteria group bacterium]
MNPTHPRTRLASGDAWKLIIAVLACEFVGIAGSVVTSPAIPTWYASLPKSALNPPGWVFGPVWTILFAVMGVSVFLIWRKGLNRKEVKVALVIFAIQLALNALWSILFFGLHNPFLALCEIVILWISILFTMVAFYPISRVAAWLLLPYILWVSFASYLNFAVWQLSSILPYVQPKPIACTMEAMLCPDGSYVGRTGPNCEFAPCAVKPEAAPAATNPESTDLPLGYTLKTYTVANVSNIACTKKSDCITPPEYLMASSCPYTSLCLKNVCTVVCPGYE